VRPAVLPQRARRHARAASPCSFPEREARYRAADEEAESRSAAERRILIVDDESAIRLVCQLNLDSVGFQTLEASDGETALALARTELPDLILLDVMLPGIDGWEVAAELAASPETREIPILFLSARSDRSDEERGHEAGGLGYITKPFDPNELIDRVREVLERAKRGEREALRREWQERLRNN
jgi:two-component system, OmpR family, alkaline phosphatase synthesis response regulator PhoP